MHDDLTELVRHCEVDLRMVLHLPLVAAKERVRALEEVKSLMDQASQLSEQKAGKKGGDVGVEFELVEKVLEQTAKYGFSGPDGPSDEVNKLHAYREDIAQALLVRGSVRPSGSGRG